MKLSTTFAMQMVEELSTILAQHINFIDKDGIIVASTDKNRIGSQHMGAKRLVEDNLPYLVIESDNEYSGSKQGVNLPIIVDEEIVGVIGITGERNVVEKYGEIIRKFTQMYIRDEHIKQTRAQEEKMVSRFLENWLMHEHAVYEANFNDIAQSLGIVLNQPRRILMASFVGQESEDMLHKQGQLDQATRYLKRALCDSHNTYSLRIGTRHVFLLLDAFDEQIKEKCLKVKEAIFNAYAWDVRFGFDANAHPHIHAHDAYIQAKKALNAAMSMPTQPVLGYKDLHVELFVNEISPLVRQEFIEKMFQNMNEDEIKEALKLCEVLYAHNGSISQAASSLYIHKNTLQYKLNKLQEATGCDPRHTQTIPLYYLAMVFMKSL
jgi:carbohydrate diacid regulator